jgi:energy-coupling factor transporter ATP-binding protein EcfA2
MYCKKCILVNWGNIPNSEFEFGPVNLFSGASGSGKSTAADALQTIMTAAHENLYSFNPGQDESSQRSRKKQVRTLPSYVLGCDDGSYSRPRNTDGYIVCIFHPTKGETGDVFSTVISVRAYLELNGQNRQARLDQSLYLILPTIELTLEHFVRHDTGSGQYVTPITDIVSLLTKEFGKSFVEVYNNKKGAYLKRLYGAFKGSQAAVSDREAKHAARTFSNFMAYKPVDSINDFVAQEVLGPKDLSEDIKQVSDLMKTIHGMEEETRQVIRSITNLELADNYADAYIQSWTDQCLLEYTEITRQLRLKQKEYLQALNNTQENDSKKEETKRNVKANSTTKKQLEDQRIDLIAKRKGISVLDDKDKLEASIANIKQTLAGQAKPLLEQNHLFSENFKNFKKLQHKLTESDIGVEIPTLDSNKFHSQLTNALAMGDDTGIDAKVILNGSWDNISELAPKLEELVSTELLHHEIVNFLHDKTINQANESIRDQVFSLTSKRKEQQDKTNQNLKSKALEIQKIENKSISYPFYVEQALIAIESECPNAKPSVLCDYIEVIDPKWQMSIEGYIGGNRFSIIVEPKYEAEAIRIIRSIKGRRNNARVIQSSKVLRDGERSTTPRNSIIEIMKFEHKVAEYYIKASYGNVICVNSENELAQTGRGVTANGLGSGGYSMYRCDIDDGDLVFGQGARDRALKAKREQLITLEDQSQISEKHYREVVDIFERIEKVKFVNCADVVRLMLEQYQSLKKSEQQLANLDLSDFEELEVALYIANDAYEKNEQVGQSLQQALGQLNEKSKQLDTVKESVIKEQNSLQAQQDLREQAVLEISKSYVSFECEKSLEESEKNAESAGETLNFKDEISKHGDQIIEHERKLNEIIVSHNQTSRLSNTIAYNLSFDQRNDFSFFSSIIGIKRQVESIYNGLKNNVLIGKHEKIRDLRDSFNTAFVTNLCHSIFQSINDGKRVLDDLNVELKHHRFGSDQEVFYFGYKWIPEFKEYHRFFKEVIDMPNLGDGSSLFDAELSAKSCEIRDKLLSLLLDNDEQVGFRELKRISDYRKYREYEIYKEPLNKAKIALSTYGTGSGGQLETPAYIIRAAAVTSAFRFNEGNTHCRMVIVDEAFSKMDENRSKEVINYLTETLGLQLIFIMPSNKSGPFMDLISNQIVFSKCPSEEIIGELNTQVLVDRKVCNQEKIKDLWANHRKIIRYQGEIDFLEGIV